MPADPSTTILPIDIPWERLCVSEDMLDPHVCDDGLPPKWQSSIAVFRYVPDAEHQTRPGRRLVYYKLVCTITGYQPADQEIESEIDFARLHVEDAKDFQERLKAYLPCHGAVIQVTVGPREKDVPLDQYPYFLDFQPKQRALYERNSAAGEQVSRSVEGLNVHQSGGTTDSLEVLDADPGFAAAVPPQLAGEARSIRVSHPVREAREELSHTTQLAQLYNLFQAYHLGTNRALFYVAPRPHLLEEPTGFIRGPRVLDGIQEMFLVVDQAEAQGDPCLAVRLDTSHLTKRDIKDFDRSRPPIEFEIARDLPAPEENSPGKVPLGDGDPLYDCFALRETVRDSRTAPAGFRIEQTDILVREDPLGTSRAELSPDRHTVALTGDVESQACLLNADGVIAKAAADAGTLFFASLFGAFPERRSVQAGHVRLRVRAHLVSEQRTVKVGEESVLVVTSRGLCCCPERPGRRFPGGRIIGIEKVPFTQIPAGAFTAAGQAVAVGGSAPVVTPPVVAPPSVRPPVPPSIPDVLTAREANLLADTIGDMTRRISTSVADPEKQRGLDAAYLVGGLINGAADTFQKQRRMRQPLAETKLLSRESMAKLGAGLGVPAKELTRYDAATAPDTILAEAGGVGGKDLTRLRLRLLGMAVRGAR